MCNSTQECWIKPELKLDIDFDCHHSQPLWDTTELIQHKNSCNNDIHKSVWLHAVCSRSGVKYTSKYKCLFSFVALKHVSRVYTQVFDPATSATPWPE